MKKTSLPIWTSLGLAVLAGHSFAQSLTPGMLRAYPASPTPSAGLDIDHLIVGDYDGDFRQDAVYTVDGDVVFCRGLSGFGTTLKATPPGGGAAIDTAHMQVAGSLEDTALVLVDGGSQPGLYRVTVDSFDQPTLLTMSLPAFNGSIDVDTRYVNGTNQIFALDSTGASVIACTWDGTPPSVPTTFTIPTAGVGLKLGPWGTASATHLFVNTGSAIDIYTTNGTSVGTARLPATVQDYDIEYSTVRAESCLAVAALATAGGVNGELSLFYSGSAQEGPYAYGTISPRIALGDMLNNGTLDLVGISRHTATGLISFGHPFGASPTYDLSSQGTIPWSFPSSNFANGPVHANVVLADVDGDGDLDSVYLDSDRGEIWCQPSALVNELLHAPAFVDLVPEYYNTGGTDQAGAVEFEVSSGLLTENPTHLQASFYQYDVAADAYLLRGTETVNFETLTTLETSPVMTYSTDLLFWDDSAYTGTNFVDANLVVTIRLLREDTTTGGYEWASGENYTVMQHSRTPYLPFVPGPNAYRFGTIGGQNGIPGTGRTGNGGTGGPSPPAPTEPAP